MLAIPDEHLLKFYARKDAKSIWEAIKNRTNVKCYNYHKRDHFAKECRAQRNQGNRNRDTPRRNAPDDTSTTNALVVQDRIGYQIGLEALEARKVVYEKNEAVYEEDIAFLKQISAKDKTGLGYDGQMNESDLNDIHVNKSELLDNVFNSVFDIHESDRDDNQVNDRFKRSKVSKTVTSVPKIRTNASKTSNDSLEKPKTVRSSAPLIAEWESDIEDENVFKPKEVKKTVKPSLEKIEFVNARNITVKNENKDEKPRKGNLVTGLPSKLFENDHTCVACQKRKKHKASCIENQMVHKVKTIRCDNGTEFKNMIVNEFCEMKDIRREFSVARTPLQNVVDERKNRTLIEVVRTMLVDSKLSATFWAEAVNTACYVQNMVLVIKPHNKTPYELFLGRKPALSFMRPFGCPVTILNTLDYLGKFDGKFDDGFFVGYSINSKAFRVFKTRTRFVEENLHINFLKNKPNVVGTGPNWMLDIDTLTMSMNCQSIFAGNQSNSNAGPKSLENEVADDAGKKGIKVPRKENGVQDLAKEGDKNDQEKDAKEQEDALRKQFEHEFKRMFGQGEAANTNSTNIINTVSSPDNVVSSSFTTVDLGRERAQRNELESMFGQDKDANANSTYRMFNSVSTAGSSYVNLGGSIPVNAATLPNVADFNNLEPITVVSTIPTTRIHKDHPKEQIIRDLILAPQTRRITKTSQEDAIFQVTPKVSHLYAVKRIFRYLKGQPKLGLWYPKDSPFDLEAFLDSDYAGANLDKKSTIEGCQFLGKRQVSWQCNKQTIVANSTTEAEYVAAANCNDDISDEFRVKTGSYKVSVAKQKLVLLSKMACLERTDGNVEFHQIVDFLTTSLIHYALTVSPTSYASYIEQFWNTDKSKIVNDVKQIHSTVDGKTMVLSESSVRSDC
uniref:Integrase catalytic domain-containing protein n=1 Tax=Tanacetum cinerariifolium TaxID=118510 RepID=A0A699HWK5_TANCI|nr:hypothetical protein [Tanacetum cinerariifolium]